MLMAELGILFMAACRSCGQQAAAVGSSHTLRQMVQAAVAYRATVFWTFTGTRHATAQMNFGCRLSHMQRCRQPAAALVSI